MIADFSILVISLHMKTMLTIWCTGLVSTERRLYNTPCDRGDDQRPYKSEALLEIPYVLSFLLELTLW